MTLNLDLPDWVVATYVFVIGAVIGSFLNVCVYRIPGQRGLWNQLRALWERPSQCPRCRQNIRWGDNIPILGWFKLRGRCRNCRMRISPRYPMIEFLNGVLLLTLFTFEVPIGVNASLADSSVYSPIGPQEIPGLGWLSGEAFVWLRFVFHAILIEALLVASLIDLDLRIIPEATTTPANVFAVVAMLCVPCLHVVPVWFQQAGLLRTFGIVTPQWLHPFLDESGMILVDRVAVPEWIVTLPYLHGLATSVVGMLVGGGIVWFVRQAGFLFLREEAMGDGDVYLMMMVGAFLGWQPVVLAFFLAPLCALVVVILLAPFVRNRMIPYGPYLSFATLLVVLFWQPLFDRVGRILELGILLIPIGGFMAVLFALTLGAMFAIKSLFGWRPPTLPAGEWRPAHQHLFFSGEKVQRHTCLWKTTDHELCGSGRGLSHEERWRGGTYTSTTWAPRNGLR